MSFMESFEALSDPASIQVMLGVLLKLGIGAVLGGAIGYERERSGRPAGIRTHMLLVIGVVLFSEVSKAFGDGDPGRIAAQIVTGVGFLGAGTILRLGVEIKGLTSAASLWAASAIGMAISAGGAFLLVAVGATALTLLTLAYVSVLERRLIPNMRATSMRVELQGRESLPLVVQEVQAAGAHVIGVRTVSTDPLFVDLDIEGKRESLLAQVAGLAGVKSAGWGD